jgi:hypothetical protein
MPVFSFNPSQRVLQQIEAFIEELSTRTPAELVGVQGDYKTKQNLKNWLHSLFGGGIIDPTNWGHWRAAEDVPLPLDFGLVSVGRHPFAEDDEHVCIFAAGIHLFGTAHALRMLSDPENFARHPLGGVIEVNFRELEFAERFDDSGAKWDRGMNSDYEVTQLLDELQKKDRPIDFSDEYIEALVCFIRSFAAVTT